VPLTDVNLILLESVSEVVKDERLVNEDRIRSNCCFAGSFPACVASGVRATANDQSILALRGSLLRDDKVRTEKGHVSCVKKMAEHEAPKQAHASKSSCVVSS